ncbi:hypothetical protein DPMN_151115 [Dreissena polymorpha]|uniref:Uncharacterized protein n=1 Tax=Dreissena polymorpha TaxID=45954 RepID=A0A9D4FGZ8_DREPO|nr:hypothetical protein DPMN_151115 [Dreissena polymorpha]
MNSTTKLRSQPYYDAGGSLVRDPGSTGMNRGSTGLNRDSIGALPATTGAPPGLYRDKP